MTIQLPIYLDHNATTPCDPAVVDAMLPQFTSRFGNPSARHNAPGRQAKQALDAAREQVGRLIGAPMDEILFTSGATESNNLAIKGLADAVEGPAHCITSAIEHKAVLETCQSLRRHGFEVTVVPVDRYGLVCVKQVAEAITDRTVLISIMTASNETGAIQPIEEIGQLAKDRGVLFHTDATQAAGKIPVDVGRMNVDLMSLSGHKIYGPKGIGALYIRRGVKSRLAPLIDGGGQEYGLRGGTENVPGAVGLGVACEIAANRMEAESPHQTAFRDRLTTGLIQRLDFVTLNGPPRHRLPNTVNLSFHFVDAKRLLAALPELAIGTGSACATESMGPNYVLDAMGIDRIAATGAVRFSLGRSTREDEIDLAIEKIVAAVKKLREGNPQYELARRGEAIEQPKDACRGCGPDGCCG